MIVKILGHITPHWIKILIPQAFKQRIRAQSQSSSSHSYDSPSVTTEPVDASALPSYDYLSSLMSKYRVENLVNEEPQSFKSRIDAFLQVEDYAMEGWQNSEKQRDLSVRFHWGHNHDFGDFSLRGLQGDRHLELLAAFIDRFKAIPRPLDGLKVLDVGCWTGGTSLLLCAMGAHVVAIEEVKKYIDCLSYLKHAFNISRLEPMHLSLYDCTNTEFQAQFDLILFAGALYHVTDPILALRITFNCLKDSGTCLLETAVVNSQSRVLSYEGPTVLSGVESLGRRGWNWFKPSPRTVQQMMTDVGYTDVQVSEVMNGRCFAVGRRNRHVDMLRAGLSVRTIP